MRKCNRFQDEALLAIERGESLDDHFYQCRDCVKELRAYEELKSTLAKSSENYFPESGWEEEVLSAIGNNRKSAKLQPQTKSDSNSEEGRTVVRDTDTKSKIFGLNSTWALGLAASVAAITMFTTWLMVTQPQPSLKVSLQSTNTSFRGEAARPNDTLIILGQVDSHNYVYVRAYRDSRLYADCHSSECQYESNQVTTKLKMKALGEYRVALILSDEALQFKADTFDADILFARDSNAKVLLSNRFSVR